MHGDRQDPGSLGVYGFRNRVDHSYDGLGIVNARSITELAIWDQVAREGGRSIVIGVPPGFPPRKVNGISVGCFLTPDTDRDVFTHPPAVSDTIRKLVGHYPVDVKDFRTENKEKLRDEIAEMSRKHFTVVRHFLENEPWDYFQFVEIGLDRMHHGFWKDHDPSTSTTTRIAPIAKRSATIIDTSTTNSEASSNCSPRTPRSSSFPTTEPGVSTAGSASMSG